ncbi:hypothetical protein Hanom_Chr02g00108511 [Helianthus anomalus]
MILLEKSFKRRGYRYFIMSDNSLIKRAPKKFCISVSGKIPRRKEPYLDQIYTKRVKTYDIGN